MKKLTVKTQLGIGILLLGAANVAFSAGNLADIASGIKTQASALATALSVVSYLAGVGFAMAGILQFKAHKENPQQVPLSKPVVMILVAASLVFLPTVINVAGASLFGGTPSNAATGGGGSALVGS